jgi:SPP1 gp7 family putative phage head morphogenesis protein
VAEPTPFSVDPIEAIAFLRDKLDVPTDRWTDIWQGMHARAFVVAGARDEGLLADFHDAVNRAIAEGRTLEQFRADFDTIVAEHGWSYRGSRNWRSAVIFNTNLRMAYAAGRWAQAQRLKGRRPYLRYVGILDDRIRPLHREWHDTVLPVDDPWWQTHFPPNGWNCRCSVQQLSRRDVERLGLKVADRAPPIEMVQRRVNTGDGPHFIQVPKGIDPGFAYNVGEAGFGRGAQALTIERHGSWQSLEPPWPAPELLPPVPVDTPKARLADALAKGDAAGIRALVARVAGGIEAVLVDPLGARIHIGQAIADHWLEKEERQNGRERYYPLIPETITDPAEIWVGWARSHVSGRVELRRRYIKVIRIDKTRAFLFVADADGRHWSGITFFRSNDVNAIKAWRQGRLIFKRR